MNESFESQARRYFEVTLGEVAKLTDCNQRDFRQGFKYCLRLLGFIEKSTNEVNYETLRAMAEKMRKDLEPPPPESPHETQSEGPQPPVEDIPPPDSLSDYQ
jgi:hypothetical protein